MNLIKLTERFTQNPSYLERGSGKLAKVFKVTPDDIKEAKQRARVILKNQNQNEPKEETVDNQKLVLRSKWQSTSGQWLHSFRNIISENDSISTEEIERVITETTKNNFQFESKEKEETPNEKVLMVYTSDKHIGACTKNSLYKADYNAKVFSDRMNNILEEIIEMSRVYGTFDRLIICDLGDAIDGFNNQTTRGGHALKQNMDNIEVFETYYSVHKAFFDKLVQENKKRPVPIYRGCDVYMQSNSNHGGDIEYICHRALEVYLENVLNISTKVFTEFMCHFSIKNHTFILCHGKDKEDRKNGLPIVLNADTELFIKQYMEENNISKTDEIHFIKGDLHQSGTQFGKFIKYRNVGSIFGSSGWIMSNFGYTKPACDYDVILGKKVFQGRILF